MFAPFFLIFPRKGPPPVSPASSQEEMRKALSPSGSLAAHVPSAISFAPLGERKISRPRISHFPLQVDLEMRTSVLS